jgi:hypothetical protein
MVIFVPPGDGLDKTRDPSFYDETADFLLACGVPLLTSENGSLCIEELEKTAIRIIR